MMTAVIYWYAFNIVLRHARLMHSEAYYGQSFFIPRYKRCFFILVTFLTFLNLSIFTSTFLHV